MSVQDTIVELDDRTRIALETLATVREGRARLNSLIGLLEQTHSDIDWDPAELNERLRRANRQGLITLTSGIWTITERGRETLQRLSTEVEQRDNPDTADELWNGAPFDPGTLNVKTVNDPVLAVLAQIESGRIFLQPAFQRNFVWNKTR